MRIEDLLAKAQGGDALGNLAHNFGIAPEQARAVVDSVLPQLERRMERNTLSRGGVADLVEMLGRAGGGGFIDHKESISDPRVTNFGVEALDNILGSKDQSRAVAARAARASGLSDELIKQMLPVIAAMVMGALAKGAGGTLGEILGKITGAGGRTASSPAPRGSAPSPVPRMPESGGGWSGSGGAGAGAGDSPLPIPGDNIPGLGRGGGNPYDDLSDVIRRGGTSVPGGGASGGGGALSSIIRSVLGALLGFQSRGLIGWLVRLIVVRWGWGIVRWLVGRILLRR